MDIKKPYKPFVEGSEATDDVPHTCEGHCGTMLHAGIPEKANWPTDCRFDITVSYEIDTLPTNLWKRSLDRALALWEEAIDIKFRLVSPFTKDVCIWITDGPLPGTTLAWSFLANNDCMNHVEQRYDTLVEWGHDYLTATIVHEVGHALGLKHSNVRTDIMYPSITMNTIGPTDHDVVRCEAIGYERAKDPDPPGPGEWQIVEVETDNWRRVQVEIDGEPESPFILTPKPSA